MAEDQGYRGPFAPTSPAPKQGFAHNEESSHERGKEYRDQGSLFTYAPNGGEVEPQHQHHDREREREHDRRDDRRDERRNDRYNDRRDWNQDRYSERSEHPFKELMGIVRPLIKDLRESYGKRMNTPTKRDSTILNVSKMNLKVGWGTEIWRKRIRVTSMCRSRNSAICFSQFRISFSTFTRKLVKILKSARNCTTSFT